jgi:hypothetical protein
LHQSHYLLAERDRLFSFPIPTPTHLVSMNVHQIINHLGLIDGKQCLVRLDGFRRGARHPPPQRQVVDPFPQIGRSSLGIHECNIGLEFLRGGSMTQRLGIPSLLVQFIFFRTKLLRRFSLSCGMSNHVLHQPVCQFIALCIFQFSVQTTNQYHS